MEEPKQKIKIPRNVLVLTLSSIIWSMSDTNVDNFLSLFILKLGATERKLGTINALGSFAAMLLYPIGGYIADKSGRVRLVAAATLLYTSSFIFYIAAPSWEWAAFAMIYQSMALWVTLKYGPDRWIPSSVMPGYPGKLFFIKELAGPLEPEVN